MLGNTLDKAWGYFDRTMDVFDAAVDVACGDKLAKPVARVTVGENHIEILKRRGKLTIETPGETIEIIYAGNE